MGVLKPCFSVSGDSKEIAVLELYNEAAAITVAAAPGNPGFDDVLGQPFLEDNNGDGIGERIRPGTVVNVKVKAEFLRHEEQMQDQTGNAPDSALTLTTTEEILKGLGLLVGGVFGIRPNDRLLRLESSAGKVRVNFEEDSRDGLFVFEVRPGYTGEGTVTILLEKRRPVAK